MLTPTIHRNGDHREQLQNDACDAIRAVQDAIRAIAKIAPNGRNYYPQGPGAIKDATDDYMVMVAKLESVLTEIDDLAIAICDAD